MKEFEEKLKDYMKSQNMSAQHLHFDQSCHTVQDAANAAGTSTENLVKNICMVDNEGNLIVAIVMGDDRASSSRVGKVLNIERPRTATSKEVLAKSGYPCGGVPSFGYMATFIIDPKVMEKEYVFTGGGSEFSLVRIASLELQAVNKGRILRVRK